MLKDLLRAIIVLALAAGATVASMITPDQDEKVTTPTLTEPQPYTPPSLTLLPEGAVSSTSHTVEPVLDNTVIDYIDVSSYTVDTLADAGELQQAGIAYVAAVAQTWIVNSELDRLEKEQELTAENLHATQQEYAAAQQEYETKHREARTLNNAYVRATITNPNTPLDPVIDALVKNTGSDVDLDEYLKIGRNNTLSADRLEALSVKAGQLFDEAETAKTRAEAAHQKAEALHQENLRLTEETHKQEAVAQKEMIEANTAWKTLWEHTIESSDDPQTERNNAINEGVKHYWNTQLESLPPIPKDSPAHHALKYAHNAITQLGEQATQTEDPMCTQFVAATLNAPPSTTIEDLWKYHSTPRENIAASEVGDIAFSADPYAGLHHVGILVIPGFQIATPQGSQTVTAEQLNPDLYATGAVSTQPKTTPTSQPPPTPLPGALQWVCGTIQYATDPDSTTPLWQQPYDTPHETQTYTEEEQEQSETIAPTPTRILATVPTSLPVLAAQNGIITHVTTTDTATSISILTDTGPTITYAALDTPTVTEGQTILQGQPIATSTQTLIEIRQDNTPLNPEPILYPITLNSYANGQIPLEALCRLSTGGRLRCDAAASFEILNRAYKEHFGQNMTITDTYRDLDGQIRCKQQKGHMCATPGTSNHGWGLAIDFGGGINNFGTPQHQWMRDNAHRYGWHHPQWAQQNGSLPEPWHWEHVSTKGTK